VAAHKWLASRFPFMSEPSGQQLNGSTGNPSGPWEWLGPLAPMFAHLLPGIGAAPPQAEGPTSSGPHCDAAPGHGQLPRGVSDAIPWYRPFFWSPTTDSEAQAALDGMLPYVGCVPLLDMRAQLRAGPRAKPLSRLSTPRFGPLRTALREMAVDARRRPTPCALTRRQRPLLCRSCPATAVRTRIPYPDDQEPCFVQSVVVRAADAGWMGKGRPLTVAILPVRLCPALLVSCLASPAAAFLSPRATTPEACSISASLRLWRGWGAMFTRLTCWATACRRGLNSRALVASRGRHSIRTRCSTGRMRRKLKATSC